MTIGELISGLKCSVHTDLLNVDITGLSHAAGEIEKGYLYIALKGAKDEERVRAAVHRGAAAILTDSEIEAYDSVTVLVNDIRQAYSCIASAFYSHPQRRMTTVGVVGTNGKSTTAYLTHAALKENGVKSGLIGTIGYYSCDTEYPSSLTTPDPNTLFKLLAKMADDGVKTVIMEVSAHAIFLKKVYGIVFDILIFTNLSQDHLDFFKDMERYSDVKKSIFDKKSCKFAIVNADDELGAVIEREERVPLISYGLYAPCDVFAIDVSLRNRCAFTLNVLDDVVRVESHLSGKFNVYNIMAAAAACKALGVAPEKFAAALKKIKQVPGRFNTYVKNGVTFVVDYAHTPDGLENVLNYVDTVAEGKIITVFGCGGDRDREKRPLMGAIAAKYSDVVVITADNSRSEKTRDIAVDIKNGISDGCRSIIIENRACAIYYAESLARPLDWVIVAGKGDEKWIDIGGIKYPHEDMAVITGVVG